MSTNKVHAFRPTYILFRNSEKMAGRSEGNCMGREVDAKEMKQLAKVPANEA